MIISEMMYLIFFSFDVNQSSGRSKKRFEATKLHTNKAILKNLKLIAHCSVG